MNVRSLPGRPRLSSALTASAVSALFLLVAAPSAVAESYNWYSSTDPLNVSDDGTLRGQAYGRSYQKDGYLKNHTYYRDRRSNGNATYTETNYSYYEVCAGLENVQWCTPGGRDQSARTGSSTWVDQFDSDDYSYRKADRGRVHSKVCEDQSWSGDPCSRRPYFTFSI